MTFILQDAWAKITSTSSQRISIQESMELMKASLGPTYPPFVMVITTETADLVIAQGNSTIDASDTLVEDRYPRGNYPCTAGTVQEISVNKNTTHLAFKAEGDGNIKIALGHNTNT